MSGPNLSTPSNAPPPPGDERAQHEPATRPGGQRSPRDLQAAHTRLVEAERCRTGGDLQRAQTLCEALLKDHPDYVGALQTLGAVELAKQNFWRAVSCFHQAAIHCPRDPVNLTNLAAAYVGLGSPELAADALKKAELLAPDDPAVHWTWAEVHRANRDYLRASQAYEKVLRRVPANAEAAHGLGDCCIQLGRMTDAAAALKSAHTLKPDSVPILYALTQLPASAGEAGVLQALDHVRRQPGQGADDFETLVAFTRAAALDRRGRYEEAWQNLLQANAREFPRHHEANRRHVARMDAALEAARQQPATRAEAGSSSAGDPPLSLFIVGPSRSGKTVLERLIACIDGVRRGFESRLIEPAVRRAAQLSGLLTLNDLADLPRSLDERFREFYLQDIREFGGSARIVTDTHPGMITAIGCVAAAIPNARFVFVQRDRFDVALRIFMKPYRRGNHYAYDLKTIFEHLAWYDAMIDFWCKKFPETALSVDYEDIIARPRPTLARLAKLSGIEAFEGPLPDLGDDRGCSLPYRPFMEAGLK